MSDEEVKEEVVEAKPEVIEEPPAAVEPVVEPKLEPKPEVAAAKPDTDRKDKESALAKAVKAEEAARLVRIKANKDAAEAKAVARARAKMERLVCGYSDRVLRGQATKATGDYKNMVDKELKRRDR